MPRQSRIQPGMRFGCVETVARSGDVSKHGNTQWECRCQCGKRLVRGYSTLINWMLGKRNPPTNCHEAHVANGDPTERPHGKVRTQWTGPCSVVEAERRQRTSEMRDTPRQNVSCEECAGQPWRRTPGKRCICGGWHAEDRPAERRPLIGSSMGAALR